MQVLSVADFKLFDAGQYIYVFDSCNNYGFFKESVTAKLLFDSAEVFLSPNRICFSKRGGGQLLFNDVKKVVVNPLSRANELTVLRVEENDGSIYTILAKKK